MPYNASQKRRVLKAKKPSRLLPKCLRQAKSTTLELEPEMSKINYFKKIFDFPLANETN